MRVTRFCISAMQSSFYSTDNAIAYITLTLFSSYCFRNGVIKNNIDDQRIEVQNTKTRLNIKKTDFPIGILD